MRKDPNSIRSLGLKTLHMDKPLKDQILKLSEAAGMTQVEYLHYLINEKSKDGQQAVLKEVNQGWQGAPGLPASESNIAIIRAFENIISFLTLQLANDIHFVGDTDAEYDKHMAFLSKVINPAYAESRAPHTKELLKARQAQKAQKDQIKMNLVVNEGGLNPV